MTKARIINQLGNVEETRAGFTPGPWRVFEDEERFEVAVGQFGEDLICEPLGDTPEQAEANGYLIAAAPELYEALNELHEAVQNDMRARKITVGQQHPLFTKVEAALAKARGE